MDFNNLIENKINKKINYQINLSPNNTIIYLLFNVFDVEIYSLN